MKPTLSKRDNKQTEHSNMGNTKSKPLKQVPLYPQQHTVWVLCAVGIVGEEYELWMLGALLRENFIHFLQGMGYGLYEMLSQQDEIRPHTINTVAGHLRHLFPPSSNFRPLPWSVWIRIVHPWPKLYHYYLYTPLKDKLSWKYHTSEKWNMQSPKTLVLIMSYVGRSSSKVSYFFFSGNGSR